MASTLLTFPPLSAELASSSAPARYTKRNGHRLVQFADAVTSEAIFSNQLPEAYQGDGLTITLPWVAETATSGNAYWGISFERLDQAGVDLDDAPTWGTEILVASAANATSGKITNASFAFSDAQIDGLSGGENFRIRVRRFGGDGLDTMTGAAQSMTIRFSQTTIGGTLTVREADTIPTVVGVTEMIVDNTKLTDNGGGSVTLDISGGGGGGGFFGDGSGTNAGVGKGTIAPLASAENSLAQGDDVDVSSKNSFACGNEITLSSYAAQGSIGRYNTANKNEAFLFGTSLTQTVNYGYGTWLMVGNNNTEDFELKRTYYMFGNNYYFYGGGVMIGNENNVSWRGYLDGSGPGYLPYDIYDSRARHEVFCFGSYNDIYGGGNIIFGAYNTLGSGQSDQTTVANVVIGSHNDVDGAYGFVHGRQHTVDTGTEFFSTMGRGGTISMSSQHNKTTRIGAEVAFRHTFEVAGAIRTTALTKVDILKLEIPINTTYLLEIQVTGRLAAAGYSGGVWSLPTGAADVDGRLAMVERDATTGIRLRNNTTTDATITLTNIVIDTITAPTVTLEITTNSVTVRVTPGATADTVWHAIARVVAV